MILTKSSAQSGIYTGDLGMEIPFKTGHIMAYIYSNAISKSCS